MSYFIDPSTGIKSISRLCSFLAVLGAVGLIMVLAYNDHAGEAVTALGLLLGATWGGYTANSVARVATNRGQSYCGPTQNGPHGPPPDSGVAG